MYIKKVEFYVQIDFFGNHACAKTRPLLRDWHINDVLVNFSPFLHISITQSVDFMYNDMIFLLRFKHKPNRCAVLNRPKFYYSQHTLQKILEGTLIPGKRYIRVLLIL